ncbi:MAG: hypothetical protein U1E59_10720 [Amaricoccus sp.]
MHGNRAAGAAVFKLARSLPARVAMTYLALAAAAALLALYSPTPLCFVPLLALAWPLGIALLDHFLQAGLPMQLMFLAIGVAANACGAGLLAGLFRRIETGRPAPRAEPAHTVVSYPKAVASLPLPDDKRTLPRLH